MAPPGNGCAHTTNSLNLNSGYDPATGQALPVSLSSASPDPRWVITFDTDSMSSEPRPAYAIWPSTAWDSAAPGTRWINSYPDLRSSTDATYHYDYTFCLEPGYSNPQCSLYLQVDNELYVYLNGVLKDSLMDPNLSGWTFNSGSTNLIVLDTTNYQTGTNTLRIALKNAGSQMGLKVEGTLTTTGNHIVVDTCCNSASFITGYVWNDRDADGVKDGSEPRIGGETVHITDNSGYTNTTQTDQRGYYAFTGLTAGVSYTLTAQPATGWVVTEPTTPLNNPAHIVAVQANTVHDNTNFGISNNIPCPTNVGFHHWGTCLGYATQFEVDFDFSQPGTFSWDFGDTNSGTGARTSHLYASDNTYVATLTATFTSCTLVMSQQVSIADAPHCGSCADCIGSFAPEPGQTYVLSAWVKETDANLTKTSYADAGIRFHYEGIDQSSALHVATGPIIEGWQQITSEFTIPIGATAIQVQLENNGSEEAFFDDIRLHPFDAHLKSFVYDPITMRLTAELDENNYATFYEYDEDGNLMRIKKETERGIKTLQETVKRLKQTP